MRSGNVIGGGDWSESRIFPDMARAYRDGTTLSLRNPSHVRPWQHVLDPLNGYLTLAEKLHTTKERRLATAFNFGPIDHQPPTVKELVSQVTKTWKFMEVIEDKEKSYEETATLSLSISKAQKLLAWSPKWNFQRSVDETVKWYDAYLKGACAKEITNQQISDFEHS